MPVVRLCGVAAVAFSFLYGTGLALGAGDVRQIRRHCQADLFCVTAVQDESRVELWIETDSPQDLTLAIAPETENLSGTTAPLNVTLAGPERRKAYSFDLPAEGDWRLDWDYSFHLGTETAAHNGAQVYRLPYRPGQSHRVIQGKAGSHSHGGPLGHAIDWAMPEGTEILAARGGVVVGMKADSDDGGPDPALRGSENYLWVRHDDGTLGQYLHLQKDGVLVEPGERVAAGQAIARSGNTGYSSEPHLHFHVSTPSPGRHAFKTFPLRFALADGAVTVLSEGESYEAPAAEEPPRLAAAVAARDLPPLAERLPLVPRSDTPSWPGWTIGRYGGQLRSLTRGGRDARDMVMLGYARLVVWQEDPAGGHELVPDILERFEVDEGRRFTLHLRPGHRWSDGAPFTSEDFRFWWQDVANNGELSPAGPPPELLVDGQPPRFEVLGPTTVRYSWDAPNPRFLPALAATSPPFIYRPAHYLKPFHPGYAERAALDAAAKADGQRDWAARFRRLDHPFRFDNPERPSLQPWINTTAPPAARFIGQRNPYFHRVDHVGRQLPYIDRLVVIRTQAKLIPAQAAAGESDLQARGLSLQDFTLLKAAEARGATRVRLWPIGRGAQLALYPNLNAEDPVWRALLRSADFRRALSLAIDRAAINRVIYQDLARPGANTVLPASPIYEDSFGTAWADYDSDQASRLLDSLGLTARDSKGVRLLPDGRRVTIVVETGDTDPAETDILQLVADDWRRVGVELVIRTTGRQALRQRIQNGRTQMSIFYGLANGLASADMSPAELAPTNDRHNGWPRWGLHYRTNGRAGEAPDEPAAQRLLALYADWSHATSSEARREAWREMLEIHGNEVFTIGLVGEVQQPVVSNPRLRNLPDHAYYLYEPGAYFGTYRPDTFWY